MDKTGHILEKELFRGYSEKIKPGANLISISYKILVLAGEDLSLAHL